MLVLALDRWDANALGEKAHMHPAAGLPQGPALARRSDLATGPTRRPGGITAVRCRAGRSVVSPADPPRVCR
jgi:hypothetical protein